VTQLKARCFFVLDVFFLFLFSASQLVLNCLWIWHWRLLHHRISNFNSQVTRTTELHGVIVLDDLLVGLSFFYGEPGCCEIKRFSSDIASPHAGNDRGLNHLRFVGKFWFEAWNVSEGEIRNGWEVEESGEMSSGFCNGFLVFEFRLGIVGNILEWRGDCGLAGMLEVKWRTSDGFWSHLKLFGASINLHSQKFLIYDWGERGQSWEMFPGEGYSTESLQICSEGHSALSEANEVTTSHLHSPKQSQSTHHLLPLS
jgi:hypothetical protein